MSPKQIIGCCMVAAIILAPFAYIAILIGAAKALMILIISAAATAGIVLGVFWAVGG